MSTATARADAAAAAVRLAEAWVEFWEAVNAMTSRPADVSSSPGQERAQ